MKRILLCTTLLLLTSLCGCLAHADGTYTSSVTLVNPTAGASFPIEQHTDGNYAAIPVLVKDQFVQITGGTPSRTVYVGWNMYVKVTMYQNGGAMGGGNLVGDNSNGLVPVTTDSSGFFVRNVGGGTSTGMTQGTLEEPYQASWTIDAYSSIQGPAGNNNLILEENAFTTYTLYYA